MERDSSLGGLQRACDWLRQGVYVPINLRGEFAGATHILMKVFAGTSTIE